MRRFKELLILVQSRGEAWVTRWSRHTTDKCRSCRACEILIHRKVTAMAHVLLAGLAKFGDVEVAHLVSLFHYTQVSLLADNLTIAVATSVGRVLLHHIIGLDAAMGVRVVLRRVKHGMGVGDERLLAMDKLG